MFHVLELVPWHIALNLHGCDINIHVILMYAVRERDPIE